MNSDCILSVKLDKKEKLQTVVINYFYPELKRNRTEEITDIPHPDFNKAIIDLSPRLAHVFHSTDESEEKFTATGFKFSKDRHVIITGKMASDTGAIVGIATPSINLENTDYGFEEDLEQEINTLCIEALLLLNGTKLGVQQLTIDDSIKSNEKDVKEENDELNDEVEDRFEEDDRLNNDPPKDESVFPKDFVFPDDMQK